MPDYAHIGAAATRTVEHRSGAGAFLRSLLEAFGGAETHPGAAQSARVLPGGVTFAPPVADPAAARDLGSAARSVAALGT